MTSRSDKTSRRRKSTETGDYGSARVRDAAFEAVMSLWRRRNEEGWTKAQLAERLDRDRGRLTNNMRGPGNWTMRTFGEL